MIRRIENIDLQRKTNENEQKVTITFITVVILTFILFARPQDFFPVAGKIRPNLLFSFVALFFSFTNNGLSLIAGPLNDRNSRLYLFFYGLMVVGVPFAYHRGIAFDIVIFRYLSNIIYFLVLISAIQTERHLKTIIFTIVCGTLFYSVFSLLRTSGDDIGRFSYGKMYDPNDLAFILVSLSPLALIFITDQSKLKKLLGYLTFIISTIVIIKTGSRGGGVALGIVLLYLFASKRIFSFGKKIFLISVLLIAIFIKIDQMPIERFTTIIDLKDDYNVSSEFGRLSLWKRAAEFTLSNPVTGVGVGCFSFAIGYLRESEGILPRWQTAHSSYFLIAAEMGVPGILLFIVLILKNIKIFKGNLYDNKDKSILNKDTISFPIYVSFIGLLVASAFISQSYSIIFTLFFSVGSILIKIKESNNLVESK